MKIKAIIFDFDGVIIESMDIKARAFAYLFRDYPQYLDKIIRCHMLHGGLSRFEKFEMIYKNILYLPLPENKKTELGKLFQDYVYEEVIKCPFVNGAYEFLNKYYQKILLFVVSGTPEDEIRSIVEKRGLQRFFHEVFGAPIKKEDSNRMILKKYSLNPREVFFVGDSVDDYEGVENSGIRFIGRVTKENDISRLNPEFVINDIFDLEKIINAG